MAGLEDFFPAVDNAKRQALAMVKNALAEGGDNPFAALLQAGKGLAHGVAGGLDSMAALNPATMPGRVADQVAGLPPQEGLADLSDRVIGKPNSAAGDLGEVLSNFVNPPVEKGAALAGLIMGPMATGFDRKLASSALARLHGGESAGKVFQDTGYSPHNSGPGVAFELDTSAMKPNVRALRYSAESGQTVPLKDAMDNVQPLLDQYPQLADYAIQAERSTSPGMGGSASVGNKLITLRQGPMMPSSVGPDLGLNDVNSTFQHELQHPIQYLEGQQFGANSRSIERNLNQSSVNQLVQIAQDLRATGATSGYMDQALNAFLRKNPNMGPEDIAYLLHGGEIDARSVQRSLINPELQKLPFTERADMTNPNAALRLNGGHQIRQSIAEALARMRASP